MTMGWLALLIPALWLGIGYAAPQRGQNLLSNPSFERSDNGQAAHWVGVGDGYALVTGGAQDGAAAILCDATSGPGIRGAMQEVTCDPPLKHPFRVSGWSKAENVVGDDYCLYMDCWYEDGTNLWGQRMNFTGGTHDWEFIQYSFEPQKPITRIQYFILFRRCTGRAWFDNVSLSLAPFEVERERATPSLYGGNSIDYTARLSLPAAWTVSVVQGQRELYAVRGTGTAVTCTWTGTSVQGELLPGGSYTVRVTARDDLRGEELHREVPVTTRSGPGRGYVAWTASSMERVLINTVPAVGVERLRAQVTLAGNEYESFQVALRTAPGHELHDCTVTLEDLHGPNGTVIPASCLQWHQVGFVELKQLLKHPRLPEEAVPGWWPDPLLPVSSFDIPEQTTQSLWVTIYAPPDTPPGQYRGQLRIRPATAEPVTVDITATVYAFDLPTQPHLKTAFALMDAYLERLYGQATSGLRRQYGDFVLRHRLNPDDISRTDPPDLEDIAYYYDRGLNAFNVINMVEPRTWGNWVCWSPLEVYTPQFKDSLIRRLDPYVAELKRRGLADKAYVYTFDERGEEFWPVMREYFGLIKQRYGLPTLTTAYIPQDPQVMKDLNVDWNCPLTPVYDVAKADACRAAGLQVWAYICCGPGYPYANWLAEFPLIEARVIWWQAFHQKMDGFLYWGLNIWHRANNDYLIDPDRDGPRLRWGITTGGGGWLDTLNGDGDLLYPGRDGPIGSIRLANIRDGLEDYEYLWLLGQVEADFEAARAACEPVTTSLTAFTRDPTVLAAHRDRVAQRIMERMGRRP